LEDKSTVEATQKGVFSLPIDIKTNVKALVVPSLHEPLLSVANLCNKNLDVLFTKTGCDIISKDVVTQANSVVGRGYRRGNLYYLPAEPVSSSNFTSVPPSVIVDNSLLGYHLRFNHLGLRPLKQILKTNGVKPSILNEIEVQQCPTCIQCKMPRKAFKSRQEYQSTTPGQLIHSDVGSYETVSREGYRYFITFVDDCSKSTPVYPMKSKNDSF
jgi:hypothetical protein